ncbi:MAG: hypothetical protein HXS48_10850 [Theionarchaea archaeon]|nr:MAG: hypothetical protein AYK19_00850 [Theionarchaea archaeon DG-70-1]MBU7027423.1 hypothetical protein [Theionarchaea archaeon]
MFAQLISPGKGWINPMGACAKGNSPEFCPCSNGDIPIGGNCTNGFTPNGGNCGAGSILGPGP